MRLRRKPNGNGGPPPGPGVDAQGQTVVDPTKNVRELVEAAIQRQDDLREMTAEHAQIVAMERVKRQDDLRMAEAQHLRELADVRAQFEDRLAKAESNRIDAIRAVDVNAVQQANVVSATQASTLAAQVATSAEALRTQAAAAATDVRATLAAALEPIQKDVADLRRAQYEAQGSKTQIIDTRASGQNVGVWIGLAITGFIALLSIIGLLIAVFMGGSAP